MSKIMRDLTTILAIASSINNNINDRGYAMREARKAERIESYQTHKANKDKKAKRKAIQKSKRINRGK